MLRRFGRLARSVVVGVLVAACSGAPGMPDASGPDGASPAASPEPTAGPGETIDGCPNFVEVVETGPTFGGEDQGEFGPLGREQDRLRADVEAAQAYGMSHPDEFGHVRYENGPRVRLVVTFTGHLAEHCAALRDLLAFPDEFEITRAPATAVDLEQVQAEINDLARGFLTYSSGGGAGGVVEVDLRADGEAIARQILDRYGDLVKITVGLLSYPDGRLPEGGRCSLPLDRVRTDSPFRAVLQLDEGSVHSGADFGGTVRITNVGLTTERFESGQPMTAVVLLPGGPTVVGMYVGGIAGTGAGAELGPLETYDLEVVGGTASCDPALGYALPPGEYEVRTLVDQYVMHDAAPTEIFYLLSEPAPLTIVP